MAKMSITHFAHREHVLQLTEYKNSEYWCNFCKKTMYCHSEGYTCKYNICEFDIHVSCSAYPEHLSFPAHPDHMLNLKKSHHIPYKCELCGKRELSDRYIYRCSPCSYEVHPRCLAHEQVIEITSSGELGKNEDAHESKKHHSAAEIVHSIGHTLAEGIMEAAEESGN